MTASPFRRADGSWSCIRDHVSEPCGNCDGCRQVAAEVSASIACPACSSPRYETAYEQQQRLGHTDTVVCTDCGVFVMNVAAHDRFHEGLEAGAMTLPSSRPQPSASG